MPKTDYNSIKTESGDSKYMKFPVGDSKIRIVSDVYSSMRHGMEIEGAYKNICCPKTVDPTLACPLCKKEKPRQKWIVKVIDRKDGLVKILESGTMIFSQLASFVENVEYGDPTNYDITVTRIGERLETKYTLVPSRSNTELTEEEVEMVKVDKFDLELYTTPRPIKEIEALAKGEEVETDLNVADIPF